ncbi:MAG: aspartate kinase [Firmicutes bacterium]|nr:aspartate kinase [[Eubacterium] siraeum]MCM1488851.1 aspartate kinase [Bacillota bacterium]
MAKVVKFGGSSLADANQFRKVAQIIRCDSERRYVVPSAPGKRFSDDTKVTDMLYRCYEAVGEGKNAEAEFLPVAERFDGIISDLGLALSLDDEYEIIAENFKKRAGRDYAASRGEYLNSIILANYLGFQFVDAAKCVFFTANGEFDADLTDACLASVLEGYSEAVIPGFYGAKPDGTIQTFSRGGSDFTGSVVAKAIGADLYENWTDVSGFLAADPRIVEDPEIIDFITYKELRELSYMGAGVLHQDAIFPVRSARIPINIRNTNKPEDPGTMIVPEAPAKTDGRVITGIAGKKHFSVISIEKDEMNAEVGFLRRILTILDHEGLGFEHIPTGIDTMSLVVSSEDLEKRPNVVKYIKEITHPNHIEVISNLALIAVVGRSMKEKKGTATRIFAALSHANINIKMIDQGSSELNIIVGIDEKDFEKAIKVIYDMFMLSEQ